MPNQLSEVSGGLAKVWARKVEVLVFVTPSADGSLRTTVASSQVLTSVLLIVSKDCMKTPTLPLWTYAVLKVALGRRGDSHVNKGLVPCEWASLKHNAVGVGAVDDGILKVGSIVGVIAGVC